MIHWDWVWTITIMSIIMTTTTGIWNLVTEPIKADRMRAEAALLETKMAVKKMGL